MAKEYLQLAAAAVKEVEHLTSTSVQLYRLQCELLTRVLVWCIKDVHFKMIPGPTSKQVNLLKEFYRVVEDGTGLIRLCCDGLWLKIAILLADGKEAFSLRILELIWCRNVILKSGAQSPVSMEEQKWNSRLEIAAHQDERDLLERLNEYLADKSGSTVDSTVLARALVERLNTMGQDDAKRSSMYPNLKELRHELRAETKRLGKGGYAAVFKAKLLGVDYAWKRFYQMNVESFEREAAIAARLHHPNVVPLIGCFVDGSDCSLLMELMTKSLVDYLEERCSTRLGSSKVPLALLVAVDIMIQTADGMRYLHQNNVVHRDLKPQNILVTPVSDSKLAKEGYVVAKLADFGSAKPDVESLSLIHTPNAGTLAYRAPEIICGDPTKLGEYSRKADVYSFAITCYQILTGNPPYSEEDLVELRKKVIDGVRPELKPGSLPLYLRAFIEACWHGNAQERPAFREICFELRRIKCFLLTGSFEEVSVVGIVEETHQRVTTRPMNVPFLQAEPVDNVGGLQRSAIAGKRVANTRIENVSNDNEAFQRSPGRTSLVACEVEEDFVKRPVNEVIESGTSNPLDQMSDPTLGPSYAGSMRALRRFDVDNVGVEVNELLGVTIKASAPEKVLLCRKMCKRLHEVLVAVKPSVEMLSTELNNDNVTNLKRWMQEFKDLLKDAKMLVEECAKVGTIPSRRNQISSEILKVGERIAIKFVGSRMAASGVPGSLYQTLDKMFQELRREHGLMRISSATRKIVGSTTQSMVQGFSVIKSEVNALMVQVGKLALGGGDLDVKLVKPKFDNAVPSTELQLVPKFVFGMEKLAEKMRVFLLMEEMAPRCVGIRGSGGAGKTLLAQLMHNCDVVRTKFTNSILWLTVGRDATMESLHGKISGFLALDLSQEASREDERTRIHNEFLKRRVLLILDDVWEENRFSEWLDFAKGPGSVTLITTRTHSVLLKAQATEFVVMELSEEYSWDLFCVHAFHQKEVPVEIEPIARKVVAECGGLPLALKVVGGAMMGKTRVEEWRVALRKLEHSGVIDRNVEVQLYHRLKMSYDELDFVEPRAKECFLYFGLFPEDYAIKVQDLFDYWIGEGLVGGDGGDPMDDAHAILGLLVGRSLINFVAANRSTPPAMSIHDMLRDLALYIVKHNIPEQEQMSLFQAGKMSSTFPAQWLTREEYPTAVFKAQRLSFMDHYLNSLPTHLPTPNLRSLLLPTSSGSPFPSMIIPDSFFGSLSNLRVLDLRRVGLEVVPESLGKLSSLVYLNLSHSKFKRLPDTIENLQCLEHLDLSDCEGLEYIPHGITKLATLKFLNLWECNRNSWVQGPSFCPYKASLDNIGCLSNLLELHTGAYDHNFPTLPKSISNFEGLRILGLDRFSVPDTTRGLLGVEDLHLSFCKRMVFPQWLEGCRHLVKLELGHIDSLEDLPALDILPCLKRFRIAYCRKLKAVPTSFVRQGGFPYLEQFEIFQLHAGKGLPNFEFTTMPRLQFIRVSLGYAPDNFEEFVRVRGFQQIHDGYCIRTAESIQDEIFGANQF